MYFNTTIMKLIRFFLAPIHHMGKQNAATLWVLWCPLFWFYTVKLCFTAWGVGRKTGVEMQDAKMALFGFWVLLDVTSLMPPTSAVHHRCVVKYWISYFWAIWELFAHQPEVLYTLAKMLEVVSFTTAVILQCAGVWVSSGVCKMYSSLPSALSPAEPVTHHSQHLCWAFCLHMSEDVKWVSAFEVTWQWATAVYARP